MRSRKPPGSSKKLVWRISESAPLGEFVDPDARAAGDPAVPARKDRPEVSSGGWVVSSFELLHGTDVSENPDTVPDDVFDELFPSPKKPPEPPGDK